MCVQEKSRGLIYTPYFFRENEFLLEFPLFTLRIKTVKREIEMIEKVRQSHLQNREVKKQL